MPPRSFSDFGIKPTEEGFVGDFIEMKRILDKPIKVLKFKIGPSQFNGQRLDLQIELHNEKRVTWNGSKRLIEMIQEVPADGFPFDTTIVETESGFYQFT